MLLETLLICSLSAGALSVAYLLRNQSNNQDEASAPETDWPQISGDRFLVLNAEQLINTLDLSPLIANIKNNLGLSNENWHKDALPFLHRYIEFVQRLPASESHHHAGDGGLAKHTLDVACLALIASTSQSWPPNAKTEDIARKTAVWRYGIMCAAILHDVGKTMTGFEIELYADAADQNKTVWLPDTGSMADSGRKYYRVNFSETKSNYSTHAEIAWAFFQSLVPAHVRRWIAETDPNLMIELRNYLSGQKNGSPLQEIITRSDMTSVSRDLKSGSRQRFASAKRTPLIETLMETLREMLADRGAYFSVAIAAGGDLFRKDDLIYIMAKNVPDYVRQYLRANQHRAAPSFPSDNQRIFDTLYEYGAIIPASDPYKAVSNIEVCFTRGDGQQISTNFSVLCFKAAILYPDGKFPEEFKGRLKVLAGKPVQADAPNETEKPSAREESEKNAQRTHPPFNFLSEKEVPIAEEEAKVDAETLPANLSEPATQNHTGRQEAASGIDGLLSKFDLIPEQTTESLDSEQAESAPVNPPTLSDKNEVSIVEDTPAPNTIQIAKAVPSTSPSKEKNEPKAKKQSSRALLNQLFTTEQPDTVSVPKNADSSHLPQEDTAQAGIREIIHDRQSVPNSTPRPVKIAKTPTLETIPATKDIIELEGSMAEHELRSKSEKTETAIPAIEEKKLEARQRGIQFIHWLGNGLADGTISTNQPGSPVHFIDRGMLLVSPVIFRDYAGGVFNKADTESFGPLAQKGFEALRLHERTKRSALFRTMTTNGSNKRLFYCYLIPEHNIKHIIQPSSRPANNTEIALEDDANLLNLENK